VFKTLSLSKYRESIDQSKEITAGSYPRYSHKGNLSDLKKKLFTDEEYFLKIYIKVVPLQGNRVNNMWITYPSNVSLNSFFG